jgi:hypothetical protein
MNEDQLRAQLEAVYGSTSWKVTAPLRLFSKCIKSLNRIILKSNRIILVDEMGANDLEVNQEGSGYLQKPFEDCSIVEKPPITMSSHAQQLLKEFEWRQLKK